MRLFKTIKFKFLGAFKPGAFVYFVTNDKIFANKISLDVATHSDHDIIVKSSGEELLQELTFNPPPKNSLPLIILDNKLSTREQTDVKNGIEVLEDLKKMYPDYAVVLLYEKKRKNVKNKALKSGADESFVKNENTGIRILHFINTRVNIYRVAIEKQLTRNMVILFIVFLLLFFSVFTIHFFTNLS